jgi:5-methylcytosine-specific restriction endonuclease McrA
MKNRGGMPLDVGELKCWRPDYAARLERLNKQKRSERLRLAREKATHTKEQWRALLQFCGYRCVRCGLEGYHLDKDHIVPLYLGGSDGIDNLQPLCAWCNASKSGETIDHRPIGWQESL